MLTPKDMPLVTETDESSDSLQQKKILYEWRKTAQHIEHVLVEMNVCSADAFVGANAADVHRWFQIAAPHLPRGREGNTTGPEDLHVTYVTKMLKQDIRRRKRGIDAGENE